jgi:hypothetical protein
LRGKVPVVLLVEKDISYQPKHGVVVVKLDELVNQWYNENTTLKDAYESLLSVLKAKEAEEGAVYEKV